MARRSESVAQREARERLRERHELEVRAVTEFFGIEDRIDALRGQNTVLEDEQADCVIVHAHSLLTRPRLGG